MELGSGAGLNVHRAHCKRDDLGKGLGLGAGKRAVLLSFSKKCEGSLRVRAAPLDVEFW